MGVETHTWHRRPRWASAATADPNPNTPCPEGGLYDVSTPCTKQTDGARRQAMSDRCSMRTEWNALMVLSISARLWALLTKPASN